MNWILVAFTACLASAPTPPPSCAELGTAKVCISALHTPRCTTVDIRHDAPQVLLYASKEGCEYGAKVRSTVLGAQHGAEVTSIDALCIEIEPPPELEAWNEPSPGLATESAPDTGASPG